VHELVARRAAIEARRHPLIRATAVKLFADGIIESSTASLLAPYDDDSATDPSRRGAPTYPPEVLLRVCAAIDAAGFDVHAHAIGDGAVRDVLDALEAMRRLGHPRETRHTMAHLELVDDDDIGRFSALGVIAACQPLWAVHDEADTILQQRLGAERLERRYPFGRLRDAGAQLAMGSDWNVSTADPLSIMQAAITRLSPEADRPRPLGPPHERLELSEVLAAYTSGSARALRLERQVGTIEPAKAADLVLLEADPFRAGVELPECRVRLTMVAGRIVYEA
jgi:predicted amidohydrolase YtcJ